jgi:hypothetical protein
MGSALQRAPVVHCERRRPEKTTLYQLVQEHIKSFLAQVEAESGAVPYPSLAREGELRANN